MNILEHLEANLKNALNSDPTFRQLSEDQKQEVYENKSKEMADFLFISFIHNISHQEEDSCGEENCCGGGCHSIEKA